MRKSTNLRWLASNLDYLRVPLNSEERAGRAGEFPYWGANGVVGWVDDHLLDEKVVLIGEDGAPFFDKNKDVAFVVEGKFWPNNHIHVLRPRRSAIMHEYLAYWLNTVDYSKYINGSTRDKLTQSQLGSISVSYPDLQAQRAIVDLLDRETGRIDALIAKKERLVDLLQEAQISRIVRAVTLGLDRSAELVDVEDPRVGRMPRYWTFTALGKEIVLQRGVDITKEQQDPDGEYPVVSSGGVSSLHSKYICRGPGVLVGRKGSAGSLHYVEQNYWPHDTTLYVRDFRGNVPRFVFYKLMSLDIPSFDRSSANPTINRNLLHPMKMGWPPLSEQTEIARFLDGMEARKESLARRVNRSVDLLRELRSSLIAAAVTGQIDPATWVRRGEAERKLKAVEEAAEHVRVAS